MTENSRGIDQSLDRTSELSSIWVSVALVVLAAPNLAAGVWGLVAPEHMRWKMRYNPGVALTRTGCRRSGHRDDHVGRRKRPAESTRRRSEASATGSASPPTRSTTSAVSPPWPVICSGKWTACNARSCGCGRTSRICSAAWLTPLGAAGRACRRRCLRLRRGSASAQSAAAGAAERAQRRARGPQTPAP